MFFLYSSMWPVKLDTLFLCCQRTLINRHLESPLKLSGNTPSVSKGSSLGLYIANIVKFNRVVSVCLWHFNTSIKIAGSQFYFKSTVRYLVCICHYHHDDGFMGGDTTASVSTGWFLTISSHWTITPLPKSIRLSFAEPADFSPAQLHWGFCSLSAFFLLLETGAFCLFTSIVVSSDYDCIMQPKAFSSIHLFLITKT